jgi:hypothetical protein
VRFLYLKCGFKKPVQILAKDILTDSTSNKNGAEMSTPLGEEILMVQVDLFDIRIADKSGQNARTPWM